MQGPAAEGGLRDARTSLVSCKVRQLRLVHRPAAETKTKACTQAGDTQRSTMHICPLFDPFLGTPVTCGRIQVVAIIVRWGAQGALQVGLFSEGLPMVPFPVIPAGTPPKCQADARSNAQNSLMEWACRCSGGLSAMLAVLSRCCLLTSCEHQPCSCRHMPPHMLSATESTTRQAG